MWLLTLERKVGEEGNVFGTFFTLRQLGKYKEPSPAATIRAHPNTL